MSSVYWHEFANMDDEIYARNAAIDVVTNAEIQQQRCYHDFNEAEAVEDKSNDNKDDFVNIYRARIDCDIVENYEAAFIDPKNDSNERRQVDRIAHSALDVCHSSDVNIYFEKMSSLSKDVPSLKRCSLSLKMFSLQNATTNHWEMSMEY